MYQEQYFFPQRKSLRTIQKHSSVLTQASCMTVQLFFKSAELLLFINLKTANIIQIESSSKS